MACPLFLPSTPLAGFETEPLGGLYAGDCAAQPGTVIPADTLRRCCNRGYARAACRHAAEAPADAFRFLIQSNHDGMVGIAWSSERDHHPVAVGTLLVAAGTPLKANAPLERQAHALASAYFRQSGR